MDTHLAVLLAHGRRAREGEASDDDTYIWWGKLRKKNRQQEELANEQGPRRDRSRARDGR